MRDGVPTTPEPLVERSEFWMLEMVRLEVEAVPLYAVPLVVCEVEDAYASVTAVPLKVKSDELVIFVPSKYSTPLVFPPVVVAVPPFAIESALGRVSDPTVREPMTPLFAYKFVDDAVVEKNDVEVACPSVTLPLNVLVPEKVLLVVVPKARESVLDENWSG